MVVNENSAVFEVRYRNRSVRVTLEFPKEPDETAERALADRLKELYFRRITSEPPFDAGKAAGPSAGRTEGSYV